MSLYNILYLVSVAGLLCLPLLTVQWTRYDGKKSTHPKWRILSSLFENTLVWVCLLKFCKFLPDSRYSREYWSWSTVKCFHYHIFFFEFLVQISDSSVARSPFFWRQARPRQSINIEGNRLTWSPKGMLSFESCFGLFYLLNLF